MKKQVLILLAGCFAIGIAGTIVLIASILAAPSPAQRFRAFAEQSKRDAASKSTDAVTFREYYHYDVVQTNSILRPYRATISFYDELKLWEYAYEFRDGTWSCTGAVIRHSRGSSESRKVEVLSVDDAARAPFGEIFTAPDAKESKIAS